MIQIKGPDSNRAYAQWMAVIRPNREVRRSCLNCFSEGEMDILANLSLPAVQALDSGRTSQFYQRGECLYEQGAQVPEPPASVRPASS